MIRSFIQPSLAQFLYCVFVLRALAVDIIPLLYHI